MKHTTSLLPSFALVLFHRRQQRQRFHWIGLTILVLIVGQRWTFQHERQQQPSLITYMTTGSVSLTTTIHIGVNSSTTSKTNGTTTMTSATIDPSFPDATSWMDEQEEVVRIQGSSVPFTIQQPNDPPLYYFYVYENLSTELSNPHYISQCIEEQSRGTSNCNWALDICTMEPIESIHAHDLRYISWRHNSNVDIVLLDLFQRYPILNDKDKNASGNSSVVIPVTNHFAQRTTNPHLADVFIVPYPHDSHCKCLGSNIHCNRGPIKENIQQPLNELFDNLTYYNATTQNRHLFLSGSDYPFPHPRIKHVPLRTTIGDARHVSCKTNTTVCSTIVVPFLNTNFDYQPDQIQLRSNEWTTNLQTKSYSLVGIYGRMGSSIRTQVLDNTTSLFPTGKIGNLPIYISDQLSGANNKNRRTLSNELELLQMYQQSIFCLILPGDGPPSKRFYDVIMSGCIPVVLVFNNTKEDDNLPYYPSWFQLGSWTATIRETYPFCKGVYWDDTLGIDYQSFVIQITCGVDCLQSRLESILHNTTLLQQYQRQLQQHAQLFSYGLQSNSYRYYDAYAVLLSQLGHYVSRI